MYLTTFEERVRQSIFVNKLKFINAHNEKYAKGKVTFTMAPNKFADLTSQEIRTRYKGVKVPSNLKSGNFPLADYTATPRTPTTNM